MYVLNKVELLFFNFCFLKNNNKIMSKLTKIENFNVMSNVKKQKRIQFLQTRRQGKNIVFAY